MKRLFRNPHGLHFLVHCTPSLAGLQVAKEINHLIFFDFLWTSAISQRIVNMIFLEENHSNDDYRI